MTRVLNLTSEQESVLQCKAARLGLDLDAYLLRIVEQSTRPRKRACIRKNHLSPEKIQALGGYSDAWTDEDIDDLTRDTLQYAARSMDQDDDVRSR